MEEVEVTGKISFPCREFHKGFVSDVSLVWYELYHLRYAMNFTQQKSCLSRKLLGRIGAGGVTQVRSIAEYSMRFLSVCMSSTNPCGVLHQDTLLCLETAIDGSLSPDGSTPYSAVDFTAGYPTRHLMDVWVCMSCGSVYSCSIVIQSDKLTPWVTPRLQHTSVASLYEIKQYWAEHIFNKLSLALEWIPV